MCYYFISIIQAFCSNTLSLCSRLVNIKVHTRLDLLIVHLLSFTSSRISPLTTFHLYERKPGVLNEPKFSFFSF